MLYDQYDVATKKSDVWVLSLGPERQSRPVAESQFPEGAAKFSPDGKWIVYCSAESGKPEVYVQGGPGPGPKIQISADGGMDPVWSRNGKEIFYRSGD